MTENTNTVEIVVTDTDIIGVYSADEREYAEERADNHEKTYASNARVISYSVGSDDEYNLPVGEWL